MMSVWEIIAVVMGISYLILAMRENSWCWVAGFIGTSIFCVLFFKAKLYMESGLQIYYAAMAVYGWWQWQYGGRTSIHSPFQDGHYKIMFWPLAPSSYLAVFQGFYSLTILKPPILF